MEHQIHKSGILLVNLGSPSEPTKSAVRKYLAEFLSDPRVIDLPRWRWLPILHGIILNVRPRRVAKLYTKIWGETDLAPLVEMTRLQADALHAKLIKENNADNIIVDFAMRYGQPSILSQLTKLKDLGVNQLIVVPMYPQYADSTTASVFDGFAQALQKLRYIPEFRFIHHWHDHPLYIKALAESFKKYVIENGRPEKLLLSFHGVPERYLHEGDPYYCFCHKTARLFRELVDFPNDAIELVFQSRFGRESWLQPYADKTIEKLANNGVKHIAVMCPGFAADCLETLEEMAIGNKQLFIDNGGEQYDYIPALNNDPAHIDLLSTLVNETCQGWDSFFQSLNKAKAVKVLADQASINP